MEGQATWRANLKSSPVQPEGVFPLRRLSDCQMTLDSINHMARRSICQEICKKHGLFSFLLAIRVTAGFSLKWEPDGGAPPSQSARLYNPPCSLLCLLVQADDRRLQHHVSILQHLRPGGLRDARRRNSKCQRSEPKSPLYTTPIVPELGLVRAFMIRHEALPTLKQWLTRGLRLPQFGFQISSLSAFIASSQFVEYFNRPNSGLIGGITASMSAGSFAGSLAAGFVSDRLGRRKALMVAAIIWNIGAILQATAVNVAHLVAGQVVGGISIGITSSQCCVFLAELAPAKTRGRIVGIQQWSIEWGILIMYLISYGCVRGISGPTAFRVAWAIQVIPGTILFAALIFFPESPRWLAQHERWEESLQTLANIHAKGDINSSVVRLEFEEVQEAARIAKEQEGVTYLALFGPKVIKRTICGLSVQM